MPVTRRRALALITLLAAGAGAGIYLSRNNHMRPSDSKAEFERFLANSGAELSSLTAPDAVRHAIAFYRQVRAEDCPLDESGDMLLYQWGVYDWGQGETFQFDITRQFILSGTESDEGMSQLSFTLHYTPTEQLRALKGSQWCESPAEADACEEFIRGSDAFHAVSPLKPSRVELTWSEV